MYFIIALLIIAFIAIVFYFGCSIAYNASKSYWEGRYDERMIHTGFEPRYEDMYPPEEDIDEIKELIEEIKHLEEF